MRVAFRRLQKLRAWLALNFWASVFLVVLVAIYTIWIPEAMHAPPPLMIALCILNLGLA